MVLEWKMGMQWRQERAARDRRREELREQKEQGFTNGTMPHAGAVKNED